MRKPFSESHKKNISLSRIGKKLSSEHVKRIIEGRKGYKHSKQTREKISLANKGRKHTEEAKKIMSHLRIGKKSPKTTGVNNWNWKGGITTENHKIRNSVQYKLWQNAVFARDGYVCQKTKVKGGRLVAHHIFNFSSHTQLRLAIDNGITLSVESHKEFHHKYGVKNNTREQIDEFIGYTVDIH